MGTADIVRATSADGTSIALWRSGQGPSLVVVHGTGADHGSWNRVGPLLADSFTSYALDRRGRGESGDGPEYAFAREVDDVVAAVAAVPAPVYLYGHSFGGSVAYEAALRLRSLAGLVLYEGGFKPPVRFISDAWIDRLDLAVVEGRPEEALMDFLRNAAALTAEEMDILQRQAAWAGRVAAAHTIPRELRAINDYAPDPLALDDLRTPAVLIEGSASLPRRRESMESMATRLPNGHLVTLPGQEHAANQAAPGLLAEVVRQVLTV